MSQHLVNGNPQGAPAPLPSHADPLVRLRAELGERVRFEALLADLSAAFVNVPVDEVDSQIEHALRRVVEFLDLDRGALAELTEEGRKLVTTHSYAVPGVPQSPPVLLEEQLPWYAGKIRQGEVFRFTRLPDEAPPEAVAERAYCAREGLKSNLTIPLKVGGSVLGVVGFGSFRAYRAWPDELVQRLRLVGEVLANALSRKRAEQALRASEQRYRELVETTQAVSWEADAETFRVRYVGPQVVRLLGYPAEDWYREGFWASRLHPDDRERVLRAAGAVRRGQHLDLEYRMVSAAGGVVWVRNLVTVPREGGPSQALRGVMVDVTARRSAEEEVHRLRDQLTHVARVTTLGELAAAIAHEVNQPLCAILGNAQAAQRLLAADSPDLVEVGEALGDIVAGGRRARDVIARIRGLLQKRPPEPAPLDLNDATREVVALLEHRLARKGISLSLDLSADLPPVLGDRVQLQQVLLNLMVNAIEAMAHAEGGPQELSVSCARGEAETAVLSVRDSGPGIAPEDAARAFDPFFTTKPGGLGIGLAISRSIVEAHGGRIWAESNPGRGAAFHFRLPAAKGPPP